MYFSNNKTQHLPFLSIFTLLYYLLSVSFVNISMQNLFLFIWQSKMQNNKTAVNVILYRCMYDPEYHTNNFLSSKFFVTSIYHGQLLFSCIVFHCIFSSCGVLQLDLVYPSIFETWYYLDKILMYHRIPVWQ